VKHTKCDSADQRAVGTILMNYILVIESNGKFLDKLKEDSK
jgi:hypothetical protein